MKYDAEEYLWNQLLKKRYAREVGIEMVDAGMVASENQVAATLLKWDRKGLYDYGVSCMAGWLTVKCPFEDIRQKEGL